MKNMIHIVTAACLSLLLLTACSKVDQAHFDQIKEGMTFDQVQAILGKPTIADSKNFLGLSTTNVQWQNGDTVIYANFTNDKLIMRSFSDRSKTQK